MALNRLFPAATCMLALAVSCAQAQPSPVLLKPGLWESKTHVAVSGQDNSTPAESMANLAPETRAKIERIARMRGASLDGVSTARRCLSADAIADGRWRGAGGEHGVEHECSTTSTSHDASTWQWHDSCAKAESDTSAHVEDPEHFTIVRTMTPKTREANGAVFESKITMTWIGSDCSRAP